MNNPTQRQRVALAAPLARADLAQDGREFRALRGRWSTVLTVNK